MKTQKKTSRLILGATLLIGVSTFTLSAVGQFSFDPSATYSSGQRPSNVATGDFDGDGDTDFATTTDGTGNQELIEIYLNDGNGLFSPGPVVFLPNSSSPNDIVAADFDGDGDIDMAVVLRDFNQIQMVINNGGAFSLGATASIGDRGRGMTTGDLDADGDMDIALANRNDNTATVLTNSGAAIFTSATIAVGADPRSAAFIDIDGDNDLDLAVANSDDRSVSLLQNNAGSFSTIGTLSVGAQLRPSGLASGDLNNDGRTDLAVATSDNTNNRNNATVFLNLGGSFGAAAHYPTGGSNTSDIAVADMDCDGLVDLTTSNTASNNLSVLQNLGGGVYGPATILNVGTRPGRMTAANLDADGDLDLVVGNRDSNNISVILNQTCATNSVATLVSVDVTEGTILAGGLQDLTAADDSYLHTRSGFGVTLVDLHNMTMNVQATTDVTSPTTLTITIESRISEVVGTAQVQLADWTNGGQMVQVGSYAIGTTEERITIDPQDAARFVSGTGDISLTVRHLVFVPFLAFTFESFVDHVEMVVE